jgi:hypothetical protein
MRSTARWVGGEKRRFAPDAISDRIEKTPACGHSLGSAERPPRHSLKSSLMPVLARVLASTVLTMTAQ